MNQKLISILKHPALFVGSIIGAALCLLLGIYDAIPGVYHMSLGYSHPPLDPKLDYMAGFFGLRHRRSTLRMIGRMLPLSWRGCV